MLETSSKTLPRQTYSSRQSLSLRLAGHGVELGALHHPLDLSFNPAVKRVQYVDQYSKSDLVKLFPELGDLRANIVEPQYLCNIADGLGVLGKESQDFVIAMHLIEHLPDPISFLRDIYRCLKPGGKLLLAAPDMRFTFDRGRPLTTIDELERRFAQNVRGVSDEEVERFSRATSDEIIPTEPTAKAVFLERLRKRSIHVSVWWSRTFLHFMARFAKFHLPFQLIGSSLPEHNAYNEIILLLQKKASMSNARTTNVN